MVQQLYHLNLCLKVDELKVKSIFDFDEEFDSIRELISPKTLFAVDDTLNNLQEVKRKLMQRLDFLLKKVTKIVLEFKFLSITMPCITGEPNCRKFTRV